MPAFTCSVCGETHEGLPTDWGYTLPDDVWEIPEALRAGAAKFSSDLCQYGERHFIRCVLPIPLHSGGEFNFGAWAEVDRPVFGRYLELYDEDGSAEPPQAGTLANALSPYPAFLPISVEVQFRDPTSRPSLRVADHTSLLAQEQRAGIDVVRHHEILDILQRRTPSPS